jgi:DNA-binding XRE family transcriptional regulator
MGNDEQWMRLALAVLKQAEADYKTSIIRLRQSRRYTADNIAKLHQEFTTPMMGLLCPRGIEETLALWDKKYGGAPIDPKKAPATRPIFSRLAEYRKRRGLSREQLAQEIGCSASSVRIMETGERAFSWKFAVAASRFFGATTKEIFGVDEQW